MLQRQDMQTQPRTCANGARLPAVLAGVTVAVVALPGALAASRGGPARGGRAPAAVKRAAEQAGARKTAAAQRPEWKLVKAGRSDIEIGVDRIHVDSMSFGRAYAWRPRPYKHDRDYVVSFEFRLEATTNHYLTLYDDGFIHVLVDWGTQLKHVQPGMRFNLTRRLVHLDVGKWHRFRISAYPSRKTFYVYVDGKFVSAATDVEPGRLPRPSVGGEDRILLGDDEDRDYNRGVGTWRKLSFPGSPRTAPDASAGKYDAALGKPLADDEQFVASLFRCVLHREPDARRVKSYTDRLAAGKNRELIVINFFQEKGYRDRRTSDAEYVRDAFQAVLGREPAPAEAKTLLGLLQKGGPRRTAVMLLFATSEFQDIKSKLKARLARRAKQ